MTLPQQHQKTIGKITQYLLLLLGVLVSSTVQSAKADDALFVGGGQVGGQNSSFSQVGVIAPLPGSHLGDGWIARAFSEEITYRYKTGTTTVDALGLGGNISLGYQISDANGWLGAYAGPGVVHTRLSPDDPTNDARGTRATANFQLEGERNFTPDFKANINGSYEAFDANGYWSRLRMLYRLGGSMYLGPEGVYQGDDNYKAYSVGLALTGIALTDKSSLGFDAGLHKTQGFSAAPYVGLEFGVGF